MLSCAAASPCQTLQGADSLTGPGGVGERDYQLRAWLDEIFTSASDYALEPASEDASFRRYFRVRTGAQRFIVMDAPPAQEDCRPFIDVAARLRAAGISVPEIFKANLESGFLLLSDFGQRCYFDLRRDADIDALYDDALVALVRMQGHASTTGLARYDERLLRAELELFPEWLLQRHLGMVVSSRLRAQLNEIFDRLCAACLEQPQVFVHRDYHSRNLMILNDGANQPQPDLPLPSANNANPGVIDFQDAVVGPVSYDLVSLCRDVYIDWSGQREERWIRRFYALSCEASGACADLSYDAFVRAYHFTAVQRLIKIGGIFARLFRRDGKPGYLADIPMAISHLDRSCRALPELAELARMIDELDLHAALKAAANPSLG